MADQHSHVRVTETDGIQFVEFSDRKILDEVSIAEIGEELLALAAAAPQVRMLLNFKNVDHLSSAALSMLLSLRKRVVDEQQGTLKLSDITPQIFEVFKITRLNKLFDIHPTEADARASF